MIADRQTVLLVERVLVRCDECPRQAAVYISHGVGRILDEQLSNIGWTSEGGNKRQYCEEHS